MENEKLLSDIIEWLVTSGIKLIIGIVFLIILFWIINVITKSIKNKLESKKKDETITKVVYRVSQFILKSFVLFLFLAYIGIETAGIGSIIASAAVAIGLALQGSLANIAGWFIIIVMRPFKLDDYIKCQGVEGSVEDIKVFYTCLKTPDNKVIMVPNGSLANGNIENYFSKDTRRLDLEFNVSYNNDTNKVIKIMEEVAMNYKDRLANPTPFVKLKLCGINSITIVFRVWVYRKEYWDLYYILIKDIKDVFDKENINIFYNQLDISFKEQK